jgi:hypothetical protein
MKSNLIVLSDKSLSSPVAVIATFNVAIDIVQDAACWTTPRAWSDFSYLSASY